MEADATIGLITMAMNRYINRICSNIVVLLIRFGRISEWLSVANMIPIQRRTLSWMVAQVPADRKYKATFRLAAPAIHLRWQLPQHAAAAWRGNAAPGQAVQHELR
jgi:hypothetical protein